MTNVIPFSRSTMACVKPWASKEASAHHTIPKPMVERLNGTIQRYNTVIYVLCCNYVTTLAIKYIVLMHSPFRSLKLVSDKPKNWDKFLQSTMFGLRTKKQLTTKYSPYFLMFGREARYPSEIPKEYRVK